jgi:hypothetical protein
MATLTVYSDTGNVATAVDGTFTRAGTGFSDCRNGAGTTFDAISGHQVDCGVICGSDGPVANIYRSIRSFNTSALGTGATISSAVLSIYYSAKYNFWIPTSPVHIAGASPANPGNLVTADYSNVGRTSFGSVAWASISAGVYTDFTLNGSGLAAINKTGVSSFSTQIGFDINNSDPGEGPSAVTYLTSYFAEQAGSTQDPKLVITYEAGGSGGDSGFMTTNTGFWG